MQEPYIYFDWNIVKYVKDSDTDKKIASCIEWLRPRYRFPFSFAQLCDRQKGNSQSINDDLSFLNELSEGYMVGIDDTIEQYDISPQDVFKKYEQVNSDKEKKYPNIHIDEDIEKSILESGFERYFKDEKNASQFYPVMFAALNRFNGNSRMYKEFREFMIRRGESQTGENSILGITTQENFSPLDMAGLLDNINKEFNAGQPLSRHQKILYMYLLLEFKRMHNGKRIYDKISKKNSFTNIYTDAMHVNVAQYSKCFVTEDEMTRRKAVLVYQALGVNTPVIDLKTFVEDFSKKL